MGRLGPLLRISAGLVAVTASILLGLDLLGLVPIDRGRGLEARIVFCETLAAQVAAVSARGDLGPLRETLRMTLERNDEVRSIGLREPSGHLLVAVGDHTGLWDPELDSGSTPTHVRIPVIAQGQPWGEVEVRFDPLGAGGGLLGRLLSDPMLRLIVPLGLLSLVAYAGFMGRTLRYLDPSAVVPARVQKALDVMAEGVMIVDEQETIVLANAALAQRLGEKPEALLGVEASRLRWRKENDRGLAEPYPWTTALEDWLTTTGTPMQLEDDDGEIVDFTVNASPVLDGWGRAKGAIVTLNDVTELQRHRRDLEHTLSTLEKTKEEIRLQNEELEILARRDPLTGASNRRSFFAMLVRDFARARREGSDLSVVMVFFEHFKRVNDEHGHAVGDEIICRVADALRDGVRSVDALCRYGGEEFCLGLTGADIESAVEVAERLRRRIEAPGFARIPVTASFGVSSERLGADSVGRLIDQADQALYASKQAGRNRVTRWDRVTNVT